MADSPKAGPGKMLAIPGTMLSPTQKQAALELLALLYNSQAEVLYVMLENITVQGKPAGGFEISVRRMG